MRLVLFLLLLSSSAFASTPLGDFTTPRCSEDPCNTYRYSPVGVDADNDGVTDTFSEQTWTPSVAITTLQATAVCNAGSNATSVPPINPVYSATGLPTGVSIDSGTGAISGTPSASGAFEANIRCSNDLGFYDVALTGQVYAPPGNSYYVRNSSCSDSNAGTSVALAWCTVAKVNSFAFTTGAKVYFESGGTWDEVLSMDWNGTVSDRALVSTFWNNAGTPVPVTPSNPTALPAAYTYAHARAKIRGTYNSTCSRMLNPALPSGTHCAMGQDTDTPGFDSSARPTSRYTALITLRCDYCDVTNMEVLESAGRGIDVTQLSYTSGYHDHVIQDNYIHSIGGTGLQMSVGYNNHAYGNHITYFSLGGNKADLQWADHAAGIFFGSNDSTSNSVAFLNDAGILLEKNDVYMGYGEGILFGKLGGVIVRANRLGNLTDAPLIIGPETQHTVIEYNLVMGGSPSSNTTPAEYGIAVFPEQSPGSPHEAMNDIVIRGNMVSNSSNGFRCCGEAAVWSESGFSFDGLKVYGNTFVNMSSGVAFVNITDAKFTDAEIKNNIFYNESGGTLCTNQTLTGDTWNYNYWGSTPADTDCRGANDSSGNPLLTGSGFSSKSFLTTPATVADFVLQAGSPALNTGTALTSTILSTSNYSVYSRITYPCATFDLTGGTIDAICATRGTPPDPGSQDR